MSAVFWLAAAAALLAGVAPVAELLRQPVTASDRRRAERAGAGRALACRDGITWRRRRLGPPDAPVVLLVHGLTTPSPVHDALAERLAQAGWQTITYDLYGRGLSDRARGAYDLRLYLRQMEDVLTAENIPGPVLLVGYSMGGVLVTRFAAVFAARVRGVCLLAPGGMGHDLGPLMRMAGRLPGIGDWLLTLLGPAHLRASARAVDGVPCAVPGIGAVMRAETCKRGYMRAVLSSVRHVLDGWQTADHAALAARRTPCLAIWGVADTVIPLCCADRLHAANPQARRLDIAGADHGLPFTHADQVADAILARFGRPGASGPQMRDMDPLMHADIQKDRGGGGGGRTH